MRALLQRVTGASVSVGGEVTGEIDRGLLVFLGLDKGDDELAATKMIDKLLAYRVFPDDEGRMNRSVVDISGGEPDGPRFLRLRERLKQVGEDLGVHVVVMHDDILSIMHSI